MATRVTELDMYIGRKIREIRQQKNVSPVKLIEALNISRTQLAKYEVGNDRISASRLFIVARILNVPVYNFVPEEYHYVEKPRKKRKQIQSKKDND